MADYYSNYTRDSDHHITSKNSDGDSLLDGKRRVTLSDYKSARSNQITRENGERNTEANGNVEPGNEMEELKRLLGTNLDSGHMDIDIKSFANLPPETPGGSGCNSPPPVSWEANTNSGNNSSKGHRGDDDNNSNHHHHHRSQRRISHRDRRNISNSSSHYQRHRSRSRDDDDSSRHRRRSPSPHRRGSSHRDEGGDDESRRRSRRDRRYSKSHQSASRDRVSGNTILSMRAVFPYEDGGIIIGLRGAHLNKLRRTIPEVTWNISTESNDKQDRVLEIKGTIEQIADAYCTLANHFISQSVHIDYPLPAHPSHPRENVDTEQPFVAIRILLPHKTCGAVIGRNSETLIETRIKCRARRLYVYRDRIPDTRERVVEIIGTPSSVRQTLLELGSQVERALKDDQADSLLYRPRRNGIRNFLRSQDVQESKITLEPINRSSTKDAKSPLSERRRRRRSRRGEEDGGRGNEKSARSRTRSRSRSPKRRRAQSRSRSPSLSIKASRHGESQHHPDSRSKPNKENNHRLRYSNEARDERYSPPPKDDRYDRHDSSQLNADEAMDEERGVVDDAGYSSSSSSWDIPSHNRRGTNYIDTDTTEAEAATDSVFLNNQTANPPPVDD